MVYQAGEKFHQLAAGSFIYSPQGILHAFRITGNTPVRLLSFDAPAGLMDLYDEVGLPARKPRLPGSDGRSIEEEIPRWNEIGPRYGLQVVGPADSRRRPLRADFRTWSG